MDRKHVICILFSIFFGAPAFAEPLIPWRNGFIPNGDVGMLQMSEKGGFASAYGLAVETVNMRGDPLLLKALMSNQLESYIGGPASPMVAASKGADIKIVGCGWNKQSYVLWGNSKVKSLSDMRGKTVGISTPGSAPDIFIRAALASVSISPNDVTFVAAGTPADWLKSMSAGVIDAAATPDEYSIRGVTMGLHVITTSDKATPLSMQRCYFTSGELLKSHPDRIVKFLAAEMSAYKYSLSHREETIGLARKILNAGSDAPEAQASYDSVVSRNVIDVTFEPPIEKLNWLRDILADNGMLDRNWDPRSMIDLGALAEARKASVADVAEMDSRASKILAQTSTK